MQFICQHQKMMTKSKNPPIHWIKRQNPIHISYSHIFFLLSIWGPLYSSSPVRHKARGMGDEWVDPNPGAKHIKITSAAYASLNWIVGLSHRYLSFWDLLVQRPINTPADLPQRNSSKTTLLPIYLCTCLVCPSVFASLSFQCMPCTCGRTHFAIVQDRFRCSIPYCKNKVLPHSLLS